MVEQIYTKRQLSRKFHKKVDTVTRMLEDVNPDGMVGRWVAWTEKSFKDAEGSYLKQKENSASDNPFNQNIETEDPDLEKKKLEMDILWRTEKAKQARLENEEKENLLVNRQEVEDLLCFQAQLFTDKLKELTKEKPELFNLIITEIYADLEAYVSDKQIEHIVDDETMENVNETLNNPEVKEDLPETDQLGLQT